MTAPTEARQAAAAPRRRVAVRAALTLAVFLAAAAATSGLVARGSAASGLPHPAVATDAARPAGDTTYRSPQGWSVLRPAGWTVRPETVAGRHVTELAAADGSRYVRVQRTAGAGSPRADWERVAGGFARTVTGYHLVAMRATTLSGAPAAAWEFTYTAGGLAWHAVDVAAVVGGDTYAVLYETRADAWAAAAAQRRAIFASLKPG